MSSLIGWIVFAIVNLSIIGLGARVFFELSRKIDSKQDPKWAQDLISAVQAELDTFQAEKISWPKRLESLESKYNTLSGRISRVQTKDEDRSPEAAMREMMTQFQLMQGLAPPPQRPYPDRTPAEPTVSPDPYHANGIERSTE